jgi:hypothetical protein
MLCWRGWRSFVRSTRLVWIEGIVEVMRKGVRGDGSWVAMAFRGLGARGSIR